jgi:hypothetical protein
LVTIISDDRVERRAQLVAHAGKELRLVLACLLELPALVLDLVEQAHVLDRDRRLVGEGLHKLDLLVGERAHLQARQRQEADRDALAQHRHSEGSTKAAQSLRLDEGEVRVGLHVGNVDSPAFEQHPSVDRATFQLDRQIPDQSHEFR